MTVVFSNRELFIGYIISQFGVEFFLGYEDMVQKCTNIANALQD